MRVPQMTLAILIAVLLALPQTLLASIMSFGDIDKELAYESLKYEKNILSGTIINKSKEFKKDSRIKFEAYDSNKNKLWDTVVRVEFLPSEGRVSFKRTITYQKIDTPLTITASNASQRSNPRQSETSKSNSDDHFYQSATRLPINFSGSGKKMSDLFELRKGALKVAYDHQGTGYFGVFLNDENGARKKVLANEVGKTRGSQGFEIPYTGKFYINVDASNNSNWSLQLDRPSGDFGSSDGEGDINIIRGKDGVIYLEQKK
jgi:hypothetical protein